MVEATSTEGRSEVPAASEDEGPISSGLESRGTMDEGASSDESSQMYYFGASTITLDHIKEMTKKGYFTEGEARAPREETTS
jgi:hypothetical protein